MIYPNQRLALYIFSLLISKLINLNKVSAKVTKIESICTNKIIKILDFIHSIFI